MEMEHPSNDPSCSSWRSRSLLMKARACHGLPALGAALAIGFGTLACYAGLGETDSPKPSPEAGTKEQAPSQSPEQAIKTFVALAEKGQIDKIVLHYCMWERVAFRSVREGGLIGGADLEMTLRGATMLQKPVLTLAKTLDHPYLTRRKSRQIDETVDFGLGFICYSNEEEVIRAAISKEPPILSVNGEHFFLPPELLQALAPLLPSMVYKGMLVYIVSQWAPPGPWEPRERLKEFIEREEPRLKGRTEPALPQGEK